MVVDVPARTLGLDADARIAVDPAAAARLLSISRTTVYELLNTGALRSYRVGAARRIPVSEIHRWQDARLADEAERTK